MMWIYFPYYKNNNGFSFSVTADNFYRQNRPKPADEIAHISVF